MERRKQLRLQQENDDDRTSLKSSRAPPVGVTLADPVFLPVSVF